VAVHLLERGSRIRSRREQGGLVATLRHVDVVLVASTLVLTLVGLVMVYSATRGIYPADPTYFLKRQIVYAALGVVVMAVCMFVDYRRLEEWGYVVYGLVVASLLAVLAVGRHVSAGTGVASADSAQRWIGFGPLHLQPSEFGVLAVVVATAVYVDRHGGQLGPKQLAALFGLALVPMLLVYKQPDLGTTIVTVVVFYVLLVFAGVRGRYLVGIAALGVAAVAAILGLHLLHGYQLQRLESFLHPNQDLGSSGYELIQAKTAIGAGGLRGAGLFNGQVTNLGFVPVQYADFIFSAIGEQLGFVGSAAVLGLFAVMVLRIFRATQKARDTVGRLLCAGCLAFVVFSVFQNVGMNVGIMPITGIPLPFISYGGSALLAFFAAVGLVANVEIRRHLMR